MLQAARLFEGLLNATVAGTSRAHAVRALAGGCTCKRLVVDLKVPASSRWGQEHASAQPPASAATE